MAIGDITSRVPEDEQIPRLREYLTRLVNLSRELLPDVPIAPGDDFAFMALTFLTKQVEHSASILKLGPVVDTRLIVRSMIEGVGQMVWAGLPTPASAPTRAALWQYYYSVLNWRVVQRALKAGEAVTPEQLQGVQADISAYGAWYLDRKPRKNDPYRQTWYGTSIGQMFRDIDQHARATGELPGDVPGPGEGLYQDLYAKYSAWHHWDVVGIGDMLTTSETGEIRYDSRTPQDAAEVLRTAIFCTLVTAHAVNGHLKRARDQDLNRFSSDYHAWLSDRSQYVP